MARQPEIQYVNYRVDGTAARKLEKHIFHRTAASDAAPRPETARVIAVDPVALCAIALAVMMLFAMVAGLVQYRQCLKESQQMNVYVQQLQQENAQLQQTYEQGYDPEEIMQIALDAGMVPANKVARIMVEPEKPAQQEIEMSFWQSVTTFLAGFFA